MARASVAWAGWGWREQETADSVDPATNEQRRQMAQAALALRVAPLFGLGGVAALGQGCRGSSRFARSVPAARIVCTAGRASISTGS
jgi:hypothetical protein